MGMCILVQLVLSPTARWSQNGITVAGLPNGIGGVFSSQLKSNTGLSIGEDDTLYIADTDNNRIAVIRPGSTTAVAFIGTGSTDVSMNLIKPKDVYVTRTSIYVMDSGNNRILKFSRNGTNPITVVGSTGDLNKPLTMADILSGSCLFVDNYAQLYVSDDIHQKVIRFPANSLSGVRGANAAGNGMVGPGPERFNDPRGLFVDEVGMLYVVDHNNHRVQRWQLGDRFGETVAGTEFSDRNSNQLTFPISIVVDLNGYMYISDAYYGGRIMRWAPNAKSGECIVACTGRNGINSDQLSMPSALAFDSNGSLYVSDSKNHRVQKFEILHNISEYNQI
jgi:sugar lactone lactonase YvrE